MAKMAGKNQPLAIVMSRHGIWQVNPGRYLIPIDTTSTRRDQARVGSRSTSAMPSSHPTIPGRITGELLLQELCERVDLR